MHRTLTERTLLYVSPLWRRTVLNYAPAFHIDLKDFQIANLACRPKKWTHLESRASESVQTQTEYNLNEWKQLRAVRENRKQHQG